jgi:hypothetical protein
VLFVEVSDPAASSTSTPMADPTVNSDGDSAGVGDAAVGASASSPVDVNASPTVSMTKTTGRVRASRSDLWQDMDEVKKVIGKKEVRVDAICNVCKSRLSASSNSGTGHLRCHIKACKRKSLANSSSQSHLHFGYDGHVQHF